MLSQVAVPTPREAQVQSDLELLGYTRAPLPLDADVAEALRAMAEAAWRLPRDEYYMGGDRFRRMSAYVASVQADGVEVEAIEGPVPYFQTAQYNPELGGTSRHYAPNEPDIVNLPGLAKIIAHHVASLPLSKAGALFDVNFHLKRYLATPGRSCDTSPSGLHKDGHKYFATHLLTRCGATGGEIVITDNDKVEIDRFTMREMGECYLIDDDRVWHMLTPVAVAPGSSMAYRDICLFDILPRDEASC